MIRPPIRPSKNYKRPRIPRWTFMAWVVGVLVGILGQLYAARVLHNEAEALTLCVIGLVLYAPLLVWGFWALNYTGKALRQLKIELIVMETMKDVFELMEEGDKKSERPTSKRADDKVQG